MVHSAAQEGVSIPSEIETALVRQIVRATDDGDHHPPISQWAARQAMMTVLAKLAPTIRAVEMIAGQQRFNEGPNVTIIPAMTGYEANACARAAVAKLKA